MMLSYKVRQVRILWLVFGLLATTTVVMMVYFDNLYRTLNGHSGKFSGCYFNVLPVAKFVSQNEIEFSA